MCNVAVSDTVASIAGAGSVTLGSNTLTSGGSDRCLVVSSQERMVTLSRQVQDTDLGGAKPHTGTTTINAVI